MDSAEMDMKEWRNFGGMASVKIGEKTLHPSKIIIRPLHKRNNEVIVHDISVDACCFIELGYEAETDSVSLEVRLLELDRNQDDDSATVKEQRLLHIHPGERPWGGSQNLSRKRVPSYLAKLKAELDGILSEGFVQAKDFPLPSQDMPATILIDRAKETIEFLIEESPIRNIPYGELLEKTRREPRRVGEPDSGPYNVVIHDGDGEVEAVLGPFQSKEEASDFGQSAVNEISDAIHEIARTRFDSSDIRYGYPTYTLSSISDASPSDQLDEMLRPILDEAYPRSKSRKGQ